MSSSDAGRARVIRGSAGWKTVPIATLTGARGLPQGLRGDAGRAGGAAGPAGAGGAGSTGLSSLEARIAAAFQQGVVEGRHQAATENERRERELGMTAQQRWAALVGHLETGLQSLETALADQVLALATRLAEHIACRTISDAPDGIVAVVSESLRLVSGRYRRLEITAHPDDCAALSIWLTPDAVRHGTTDSANDLETGVAPDNSPAAASPASVSARTSIATPDQNASLSIRPDPTITRGGCRIRADDTDLDATLETRLRRTFEAVGVR